MMFVVFIAPLLSVVERARRIALYGRCMAGALRWWNFRAPTQPYRNVDTSAANISEARKAPFQVRAPAREHLCVRVHTKGTFVPFERG